MRLGLFNLVGILCLLQIRKEYCFWTNLFFWILYCIHFLPLSKNGHQRKAYLYISCSILFSFCLLGGSLLPLNWEISSRNWIVNNSYLIDCSLALPCLWLYLSIPLAISINLYKWNCLILFGLLDTLLTQSNLCLSSLGPCILCLWNHHLRPIPMDLIRLVDFLNMNVIGIKILDGYKWGNDVLVSASHINGRVVTGMSSCPWWEQFGRPKPSMIC